MIINSGKSRITLGILICAVFLTVLGFENVHAFIERVYTLQEVLNESTNIVFGKVESVDTQKQRAILKVEENIKGKSDFSKININVAVGQVGRKDTSPELLMGKLKVGLPVIVFYSKEGTGLAALCYVSGTWFQIFGSDQADRSRVWWNFTHIEIHMHRTYTGTTESFQKVVREAVAGKVFPMAEKGDIKVLVLTGNGTPPILGQAAPGSVTATAELVALKKFTKVGNTRVVYQETKDNKLPGLSEADILWIGIDEIGRNGYRLNKAIEDSIKKFVQNGGMVISMSQDSDLPDKLCGSGWLPYPLTGVEASERRDFEPTKDAGDIFKKPNQVNSGSVYFDDTWTNWGKEYKILATTNGKQDIAVATLNHGKGIYVVTGLRHRSSQTLSANTPMMENIIHFSVNWLKSQGRGSS